MPAGTKKKPKPVILSLREDFHSGRPQPLRVDREKGVIYGVKILGLESANGRRYTLEAVKKARSLYEGKSVNIDHPKKPTDSRSSYDRFGWLENVQAQSDGLYGELHLLTKHEMAERIMEAAEKNPSLFGLSHNAEGRVTRGADGVDVVEEIQEVRHVDLVADPATTKSLSESKSMKTLKQFITESKAANKADLLKLLEGDDAMSAMADMPIDAPAEDSGDWKQDLVAAIGKLVASEDSADHEMAKKIMAMLRPESAPKAEVKEEDDEKKEDVKEEDDDAKDEKKEDTKESIDLERRELRVRRICDAKGVSLKGDDGAILLRTLCECKTEETIKAMVEREAARTKTSNPPRTGGTNRLTEARNNGKPAIAGTYEGFLQSIRN